MAEKRFTAGIGAANMDLHGRSRAALILHDSNPGFLHTSPGGVTRNILENLSRMGERTALFSAIGNDLYGREILASGEAVGMDMSHMLCCPDCGSSSYMALIDPEGDMFIGMSDMRILEHITPDWLEGQKDALRKADAIVCDPCLTPEALEWITSDALAGVPIFSDPVSTTYARRLAPFAGKLHCLKPNVLELSAMTGLEIRSDAEMELAADRLLASGTHRVVVSMGQRGCYWADRSGAKFHAALRPVSQMVDATGAGDAFMAGLLYAYLHRFPPERAARWALAAGIIAVTSAGTVSPGMSAELVNKILEENEL